MVDRADLTMMLDQKGWTRDNLDFLIKEVGKTFAPIDRDASDEFTTMVALRMVELGQIESFFENGVEYFRLIQEEDDEK